MHTTLPVITAVEETDDAQQLNLKLQSASLKPCCVDD